MTVSQEKAITLALNVLQVGFFECPKHYYQYFVNNDEWGLLMTAAGIRAIDTPPDKLALAVLQQAVARLGFFAEMDDFQPPAHFCSFLKDKINRGERSLDLHPCQPGQVGCLYATFEQLKKSS